MRCRRYQWSEVFVDDRYIKTRQLIGHTAQAKTVRVIFDEHYSLRAALYFNTGRNAIGEAKPHLRTQLENIIVEGVDLNRFWFNVA